MKLGALPIFLIGLAIGLSVLSFAFFKEWQPNKLATQQQNDLRVQYETEAAKLPLAQKRVKDAEDRVNEKAAQWRTVVQAHTPQPTVAAGGIDLAVHAWQLTVDAQKFKNSMQRAVNAQVKRGGVVVVNGPAIPAPDDSATSIVANYFNYPAIAFPVVIFDLGSVTVTGTYSQIMANVRSWSSMPRYLAVTDGLTITGTSPNLTGTYNLSIVGYIRGDRVYPAVPEGAAPTATGGGGGGGGIAGVAGGGAPAGPTAAGVASGGGPIAAGMAGN